MVMKAYQCHKKHFFSNPTQVQDLVQVQNPAFCKYQLLIFLLLLTESHNSFPKSFHGYWLVGNSLQLYRKVLLLFHRIFLQQLLPNLQMNDPLMKHRDIWQDEKQQYRLEIDRIYLFCPSIQAIIVHIAVLIQHLFECYQLLVDSYMGYNIQQGVICHTLCNSKL